MNDLITTLFREAIGYEPLAKFATFESAKYPPHNISKVGDKYTINLAVAGFRKEELKVSVDDGFLNIEGIRNVSEAPEGFEMLYRGIASRDFVRSWKLGEYVEVTSVKLENGMLTIDLERQVPDDKKAKTFDIK